MDANNFAAFVIIFNCVGCRPGAWSGMRRFLTLVLAVLVVCCSFIPCFAVAEGRDEVSLLTPQMRYINQFFNEDGSWSEMGLDLCKWLDMSERDVVDRINSGYLMLEEEYLYHQDTLFQSGFVSIANKSLETISSVGVNLGLDFANHQLMKTKFGDAGSYAVPYYAQLSEIYLAFLQGLEQEMTTMDVAFSAITDSIGKGANIILEDGLPAAISVMKKTGFWDMLTYHQKKALEAAEKMMTSSAPRLDTQKYRAVVNEVGIVFDFASTAAAWYEIFVSKENLTLQQQMYMTAFSKVTNEHLNILLDLRDNLHKNSSLSKSELTNIDGAIGALICDIYVARNNHMNAAVRADWNAKLDTYKPLCNAIFSTAEFGVTLSGLDDIICAATGAKGFSAVTAVAGIGNFVLSMTTQDFLDIREQTKVIYNLKKSMVESLELQLSDYATNPSHEQALAIIAGMKLLKQAKLSGEEAIAMFYIAREAGIFGLNNAPAAQAILWNELITCNALGGYNLGAEDYIKPIWTVYQNKVKWDNIVKNTLYCHIESTPIAHYRDSKDVIYQGAKLESLPISFRFSIKSGSWMPSDSYIRGALKQPSATNVQWSIRKFDSNPEQSKTHDELKNLIKSISDSSLQQISREKEYVYRRGNVEVRIPVDEFEKYLAAEKKVEQLINAYKNMSAVEYADHQTEERLIWTRVTNGYIESFPMYDPMDDYIEAVQIIDQPVDVVASKGKKATVSITARGDGLTYSWYCKNSKTANFELTAANESNSYSVTMTSENDGSQVYCVVTDIYGNSVTSDSVTIAMTPTLSFEEIQQLLGIYGFYDARMFSEGLAAVATNKTSDNGCCDWGFVDVQGDLVIAATWERVPDSNNGFSDGLAPVGKAGKYGFIDTAGNVVIEPQWDLAYKFYEGIAVIYEGGNYGFINMQGEIISPPQWYIVREFSGGMASVAVGDKDYGYLVGYIDNKGNIVSPPQWYRMMLNFSDGLACVQSKNGKWGYIDKKGSVVIALEWEDADSFSGGLAPVCKNGKWGFIDKKGRIILDYQWEDAGSFSEGLAWVKKAGEWGVIDVQGNVVLEPQWEFDGCPNGFTEGVSSFRKKNKIGYVNSQGDIISEPQWQAGWDFSEGLARVRTNGRWGFIDAQGNIVVEPLWHDAWSFSNGLALVGTKVDSTMRYGFVDTQGNVVIGIAPIEMR